VCLCTFKFSEYRISKLQGVTLIQRLKCAYDCRTRGKRADLKPRSQSGTLRFYRQFMKHSRINGKRPSESQAAYVFLNQYGKNIDPISMNFHVWNPGLKKAGLSPRSLYQTRHTFATLMLDAGEPPGWVQKMMGHGNHADDL
jgi:integrase